MIQKMESNEVLEAIKNRRSVRSYKEEQISDADLNTILEAAIFAPTGMNYQTFHFTAVLNKEKLEELNRRVKAAFTRLEDEHLKQRGNNKDYNFYYHAPALIIASNAEVIPSSGLDCAVALQNIFLAAYSLGIQSCWINQLRVTCDDPSVRELLTEWGVPESHFVFGCASLGYNAGAVPKVHTRKEGTISIVK